MANNINYETTWKVLGYRYQVKMDKPVQTNSMFNKIVRLSKGWVRHIGTETIEFIFHKDKPKEKRATCVRALCDIIPQKIETNRRRLTSGENIIRYQIRKTTVEPMANNINYETTWKVLGYRYQVKMDKPVQTNSMFNKIVRLSKGWVRHIGTETIEFIFHKDKPKEKRATCVRALCDIIPQKIETNRRRLTSGENIIDYPGGVSTPTLYLTTIKLYVNSAMSDTKSRYMCMDILK